ncbi:MAG: HlyD family secretion protein [Gammaproteobacteria bacterium]|nr:HlyD family secretion protein [Gammaproteobacteria bacterium]
MSNRFSIEQVNARFDDRKITLEQERSRIRQEIARLRGRLGFDVVAPIEGVVSRVYLQAGDAVKPDSPLFSIQPVDTELRARLLIPSRSAGFVTTGQQVNLLYDASLSAVRQLSRDTGQCVSSCTDAWRGSWFTRRVVMNPTYHPCQP